MNRKKFIDGEIYHVFNKSIANFNILQSSINYSRFINILDYYNNIFPRQSFSKYLLSNANINDANILVLKSDSIVKFLAYCIMPDHYHLLIKVFNQDKIYKYLNDIGNSYTHYFNKRFNRKGPLWQSAYKMVRIKNNEQLLHVSRYIHLNPTTSYLVDNPEKWQASSYVAYINSKTLNDYLKEISIHNAEQYKKFVENNKDYQRKLKMIKKLILE